MQITLNEMIGNPLNQEQINILKNKSKKRDSHFNKLLLMWLGISVFMILAPVVLIEYNAFDLVKDDLFPILGGGFCIMLAFILLIIILYETNKTILTIDNISFNESIHFRDINLNTENIPATNQRAQQFVKNIQSQNRGFVYFEKDIIKGMLEI